jgi:hypothetical protein
LDRVIVDKNARIGDGASLVDEHGVQEADGDGYFIKRRDHRAEGRRDPGRDDRVAGPDTVAL